VIFEPASAVTVSVTEVCDVGVVGVETVGFAGAVPSWTTIRTTALDTLPATSLAVTLRVLVAEVFRFTATFWADPVAVAVTGASPPATLMVDADSAVTERVTDVRFVADAGVETVGADGAKESCTTVRDTAPDTLPEASLAVMDMVFVALAVRVTTTF
jgi:hypothetical protein